MDDYKIEVERNTSIDIPIDSYSDTSMYSWSNSSQHIAVLVVYRTSVVSAILKTSGNVGVFTQAR